MKEKGKEERELTKLNFILWKDWKTPGMTDERDRERGRERESEREREHTLLRIKEKSQMLQILK